MRFQILHAIVLWLSLLMSCVVAHAQVTFLQPPTFAGSGNLFVADFNNDGKPDVLVSDGTMNLGNGDGTFTKGTSVSGTPLAVGDFNGDGKLDALEQGTGTLLVLLGNGDGTFQPAISTSSGAALTSLAAVDLNGDGKADVVGYFNGAILVYISKGDGTFQAPVSYNISTTASALTVGDFNGDQKPDIAVSAANQEIVLLGNGDGTLQTPKTSAGLYSPSTPVAADFNGDKKLDLAISGESTTTTGTFVLLGNGDGTFQAPTLAFSPLGTLVAADVNGDGKEDLVVGSELNPVSMIYLGNGNGTFSNFANYYPNNNNVVAVGDFNADGKLDLASGNQVLRGNGDGSFQGTELALSTPANNASVVIGDFENTGKPDVAVVSSSTVYIFHNSGEALTESYTYTLQSRGSGIVTADVNGDGKLDLVAFGFDISENWNYSVLLGNGDGSFQPPVYYPQNLPSSANIIYGVIADLNNDHQPDIAVLAGNQTVAILLGKGDGTFAAPVYYYSAGGLTGVADFNKDGNIDILAGNGILYGNGDGTFQPLVFPASLSHFSPEFIADLNNDGIPDLVSNSAQTALGNGDGTFLVLPPPFLPISGDGYFVNAVGDINGDGIPDAVAAYFTPVSIAPIATNTGVLLGNGDGTFSALVDVPTNGTLPIYGNFTSSLVLIADMNGDGRPDIVYNPQSGIAVLLNTTQAGQPDFKISATQFSPSPVVSGNPSSSTVVVTPLNGFNGDVTLSCGPQSSSFSCTLSPTTISAGSGTATATVTINVPSGAFLIPITGTSESISRSAALPLVVDNSYTPDFQISITSPSPSSVLPGGSVTAAVKVASLDGFANPVSLACVVPGSGGSTCSLSPTSVTPSGSASSTLTINTSAGATSGTQLINVYGTSGSTIYGTGVALAISSDFTISAASGSKTSQTINAGGTANFSLVLAAAPSFNGTMNLTCTVAPVVTPPATCMLSSASLQLSGGSRQTFTAAVGTTANGTAPAVPFLFRPPNTIPLVCMFLTLASLCFWLRHRKRWIGLLNPAMFLTLALLASCGGSSTATHGSSGTPAGTYTATVTATSGAISHPITLQVIVQ